MAIAGILLQLTKFSLIILLIIAQLKVKKTMSCDVHVRHHHGLLHNPKCATSHPKCPTGMFSSGSKGPCLPCSLCGEGLYVAHKCQHDKDTVCDSCHTYMGPHNRDYVNKCQPHHAQNTSHSDVINRTISHFSEPNNHSSHLYYQKLRSQHFSSKLIILMMAATAASITAFVMHIICRRKSRESGYAAVALTATPADEL